MPQMTPELLPNFSLNPGKLTGESSHLSEVFWAFPGFIFCFQKCLPQRNNLIVLYYCFFFFQVKLGVLKFLACDLFEPTDVLCHFIVATGDTRHRYVIIQLYIKLALQINSSTLYKSHLNDIVTNSWFNKLNKKIWSRVRDKIIEKMFDLTFPTAFVCLVHESPWPWSQNNLHLES